MLGTFVEEGSGVISDLHRLKIPQKLNGIGLPRFIFSSNSNIVEEHHLPHRK